MLTVSVEPTFFVIPSYFELPWVYRSGNYPEIFWAYLPQKE